LPSLLNPVTHRFRNQHSQIEQYRGPLVLQEAREAFFNMKMMRKDLRLALEMGSHVGVSLPATLIGEQLHTAGIAMGFELSDFGPGM
jgi:3-hydroxyisobutyrate dehydrogenase-like beta-hydroxyacid dehydrogenase